MVELLQALAWDIKGDDTIRASVRRNGELWNFMVPPGFLGGMFTSPQVFNRPHTAFGNLVRLAAMVRLLTIAHYSHLGWGIDG
jgi:hypothetical protein